MTALRRWSILGAVNSKGPCPSIIETESNGHGTVLGVVRAGKRDDDVDVIDDAVLYVHGCWLLPKLGTYLFKYCRTQGTVVPITVPVYVCTYVQ